MKLSGRFSERLLEKKNQDMIDVLEAKRKEMFFRRREHLVVITAADK